MPKRKREDEDEAPNIKQRRIQHKLKLGATKLGHAFKVSKGFERQKLGRRRKNATSQSNSKDVERIDSEIAALKTLDTTTAGKQHLYKSLLKIKSVSQHADLPSEVRKVDALPGDAATLNINARLCKSTPVQEALSTALEDVQRGLGLEVEQSKSGKARRLRAKDFAGNQPTAQADERVNFGGKLETKVTDDERSDMSDSAVDRLEAAANLGSSESGHDDVSEVDEMRRTARFESIEDTAFRSPRKGYNIEDDLSFSGSEDEINSDSPEPQKVPSTKKPSYLPSLTMAGYISGSDSDIDDDVDLAPKKNRRGQRARQQIWEKKYGKEAKHLQRPDKGVRWDAKRGAVDGGGRQGRGNLARKSRAAPDRPRDGDAGPHKTRHDGTRRDFKKPVDHSGPIHPSWEAAKKAKEKREIPVAFQGKKVTFD